MKPAGGKRGVTVKALKTVLKRAGLKTTGKKTTLSRRAKKARLMGGQVTKGLETIAKVPEGLVKGATGVATGAVETVGEAVGQTTKGVREVFSAGKSRRH